MIDPMADLAASGPSPDGTQTTTGGEGRDVFDMTAAQLNLKKMDTVRSFMGIVSGCVAGVCGLTGLPGLGAFYTSHRHLTALCVNMFVRLSLVCFICEHLKTKTISRACFLLKEKRFCC
mmetsp:Transcript_15107/g.20201  ORF Transcript_15107/g.20201 Transcript_15107/m.20201 type:complete len:119 (+) Transcript_15107:151-507(+)